MRVEHALEILKADVSLSLQVCYGSLTTACTEQPVVVLYSLWPSTCITPLHTLPAQQCCYTSRNLCQSAFSSSERGTYVCYRNICCRHICCMHLLLEHQQRRYMQVSSTGEALITIGGPGGWGPELLTEAELAAILKRVGKVMGDAYADITVLRQRKVPSNSEAAGESILQGVACIHAYPQLCFTPSWMSRCRPALSFSLYPSSACHISAACLLLAREVTQADGD